MALRATRSSLVELALNFNWLFRFKKYRKEVGVPEQAEPHSRANVAAAARFDDRQRAQLEAAYKLNQYPSSKYQAELADNLGISNSRVYNWYADFLES